MLCAVTPSEGVVGVDARGLSGWKRRGQREVCRGGRDSWREGDSERVVGVDATVGGKWGGSVGIVGSGIF